MAVSTERELHVTQSGPDAAPTLVFVHGWPDEAAMWRHQIAALESRYRCVAVTLPNYGETQGEAGGCDFTELVRRLHRTIERSSDEKVTLITHDWGAYIGYLYEQAHPERVESMIAMDVGGHFEPAGVRAALMFVGYQWTLVFLWLVGGVIPPLGTALTRSFARMLKVPERQASSLRSRCNYPYFYFWRANLVPWLRSRLLGRYEPQCPVLFLYGAKKPLMFHTDRWLKIVEQTPGKNVRIDDGAHWFMEEQIEQTNGLIDEWLTARFDTAA